jgi:hypothetical protein
MSKDFVKEAKNRYVRVVEAEGIILQLFEDVATLNEGEEIQKDLKVVLNLLAHYKHREVATLTANLGVTGVTVKTNEVVNNTVTETPDTNKAQDEAAVTAVVNNALTSGDYEVISTEVTNTPKNSRKGVTQEKLLRVTLKRKN